MASYLEIRGRVERGPIEDALRRALGESGCPVDDWQLPLVDLRSGADGRADAERWMEHRLRRRYDLGRGRLVDFVLLRPADDEFIVYLGYHQAVFDVRALELLIRRFAEIHATGAAGPSPFGSLTNYLAEQERYESSAEAESARAYFADRFADKPAAMGLTDAQKTTVDGSDRRSVRLPSGGPDRSTLAALPREAWRNILTAVLAVYIARMRDADDVAVSIEFDGRGTPQAETIPANLSNVLPMRLRIPHQATWGDVQAEVTEAAKRLDEYQRYRGADVRRAAVDRDSRMSFGPVVSVRSEDIAFDLRGCHATLIHLMTVPARDLVLCCTLTRTGPVVVLHGNSGLYEPAVLDGHRDRIAMLLASAVTDPSRRVRDVEIVTEHDRDQLLRRWNDTARPLPDLTVPQLFERQAAATPDATALERGRTTVSYAQLSARAGRLAWRLREAGVRPGDSVGILMERSVDLVVALLAVAKTGAAYVPLDLRFPVSRMRLILSAANAGVLVADGTTIGHEVTAGQRTVRADTDDGDARSDPFPDVARDVDASLYVMYTSGSTGVPKGVEITHRNVLALALDRRLRGPAQERVLFHSPHAFDASTYEIWAPLLSGGRVVIAPRAVDAVVLRKLADERAVTAVFLTSGLFSALAQGDPGCLDGVREVWTGGEVVPGWAVDRFREACPELTVINVYGPTENTTFSTCYRIPPGAMTERRLPIGAPMDNTRVYLLDDHLRLAPPGAVGQVYVGGARVARGYIGGPELTADRFLPDPFGPPGSRMYATGDLGSWDPDGNLMFAGRVDNQVKLHGFRVEPSEIEALLTRHPDVSQAAVLIVKRNENEGSIIGFVVRQADRTDTDGKALREYLAGQLPDYMVPAEIVFLPEMPFNRNGKVDRGRLAELGTVPEAPESAPGQRAGDCLHELFAGVAERWPDRVAVTDGVVSLSYAELDRLANAVAWKLLRLGAGPEVLVGLCAGRSVWGVVGVLGILKSGAGYVPLDPGHPVARLERTLVDAGCEILVGVRDHEQLCTGLSGGRSLMLLDDVDGSGSAAAPVSGADPDGAAYVIYTSGSTGAPKGVVVSHRNVVRLFGVTRDRFGFGPDDVWTLFHSLAFDFSVWEMWGALSHGGKLVVVPRAASREPSVFLELVRRERVTVVSQTPTAFTHLVDVVQDAGFPGLDLRLLIFGGEALDPAGLRDWVSGYGVARPMLVNMYGITETTVHVTVRRIGMEDLFSAASPIGRPLDDLRVHLLDAEMNEVPAGVEGEMYVGGAGVARGYLHRPGLTAERFVPDPYGSPGDRLYRSGDRAVRLPSGELQFRGRADNQVKLHGFRIELGEIEHALRTQPGIRAAACLLHRDTADQPRLTAYVVPANGQTIHPADLRGALQQHLPHYMIPTAVVPVAELPRTANGKLDPARLPDPLDGRPGNRPRTTRAANALATIWTDLLGTPHPTTDDNFFTLGGDSILGFTLVAQIRERLGVELRLRDLFRHPRLGELADLIDAATAPAETEDPAAGRIELAASEFQRRIWLAEKLEPVPGLYNVPLAWRVSGRLDRERLARATTRIIERHEVLRTTFADAPDGTLRQIIGPPWQPDIRTERCDDAAGLAALLHAEANAPFDLAAGPLLRMRLIDSGDDQILTVTIHHIVFDASSAALFLTELRRYYQDLDAGPSDPPRQYRELAEAHDRVDPAGLDRQVQQLRGAPSRLPLEPPAQVEPHGRVPLALPGDLLRRMHPFQERHGMSWFMVTAAALAAVLHRMMDIDDLTFGFGADIRSGPRFADVIGPCLNMVVVRSRCRPSTTLGELAIDMRDRVLAALEDQDVPFEAIVAALKPRRSADSTPYLDVVLAPQGRPSASDDIGGFEITELPLPEGAAAAGKFAATIFLEVGRDELTGTLMYRGDRLSATTAQKLARDFTRAIEIMIDQPDHTVDALGPAGADGKPEPARPAPAAAVRRRHHRSAKELEQRVAAIWKSLLDVEHVGPDDNFFDRGGNSLKLVTLHAELCRQFDREVPIQRLMDNSTVRTMARLLARSDETDGDAGDRGHARREALRRRTGRN